MNARCSGIVLAGGSGTRFGGAKKGLLRLGSRRVVDWTLEALAQATDELLMISNDVDVRLALPNVPSRPDVRRERGSLVGLHSALTHCTEAALVVAWDMPFLSPRLLLALRERGEGAGRAVIPEGPRGPEPLCAYYPKSCLEIVNRHLASGELKLSAFVAALSSPVVLSLDEVRNFGAPDRLFTNVNTPDDFAAAQSVVDRDQLNLELVTQRNSQ